MTVATVCLVSLTPVPLYGGGPRIPLASTAAEASAYGDRRLAATAKEWSDRLDRVGLGLPPSASDLIATVKANLAYILVNREGPAIEPGARSYRRSWIRDGAMISAALLRLGQADAVKAFLEWYAPYQYPNGKVPCCVDSRGADPVPENDSHGQLIYLAMEYYRQTGDRATLERMWPHAVKAVAYMDSLRRSRMTAVYQTPESLAWDFDATSTTVALAPVGELEHLPRPALDRTFERYWSDFEARRSGAKKWEAYTPYELRTVGTMLRLGWKDRAHQLVPRPPAPEAVAPLGRSRLARSGHSQVHRRHAAHLGRI